MQAMRRWAGWTLTTLKRGSNDLDDDHCQKSDFISDNFTWILKVAGLAGTHATQALLGPLENESVLCAKN